MDEALTRARDLVLQYGRFVQDKNLDGIIDSLTSDAYIEIANQPSLQGKDEIREYYQSSFTRGDYRFNLEITDEKIVSQVIFINGKMDRIFTSVDDEVDEVALHFSIILKKEEDRYKIWQVWIAY